MGVEYGLLWFAEQFQTVSRVFSMCFVNQYNIVWILNTQIFHQRGYGLEVVWKLMCIELTYNELLSPRILDRSSSFSHEEIALTTAISGISC